MATKFPPAEVGSSHGRPIVAAGLLRSHGQLRLMVEVAGDLQRRQTVVKLVAAPDLRVPLLSQEGLTRHLLPGEIGTHPAPGLVQLSLAVADCKKFLDLGRLSKDLLILTICFGLR